MSEYNGWTNYETWRVNLELFDCPDHWCEQIDENNEMRNFVQLAECLKEHVEQYIEDTSTGGIARDYALAFVENVNWREIALHVVDYYLQSKEVTA